MLKYNLKYNFKRTIKPKIKKVIQKTRNFFKFIPRLLPTIITLMSISLIGKINELDYFVKNLDNSSWATNHWSDSFDKIKIDVSQEYVEQYIGTPQSKKNFLFNKQQYTKTIYVNEYFTFICYYRSDDSLKGFLVIGNNKKFQPTCYRKNFNLFSNTINEAYNICINDPMDLDSVMFACGERMDNNRYYVEMQNQHSKRGGLNYYIGYGTCDIGYMDNKMIFRNVNPRSKVPSELLNMLSNEQMFDYQSGLLYHTPNYNYEIFDNHLKNMDIRNEPINCFFIVKNENNDTFNFVRENMVTDIYLGINKDDYFNLCPNFTESFSNFYS